MLPSSVELNHLAYDTNQQEAEDLGRSVVSKTVGGHGASNGTKTNKNDTALGRGGGGRRSMDNASRGDNFRLYMEQKIWKQRLEFGACRNNTDTSTNATSSTTTTAGGERTPSSCLFFRGVVCLINGYTNPDRDELTRRIQRFGGAVELYETSIVTHIIASQLSVAKRNVYRKRKKAIPVVLPQFILACIEHRKLLSPVPFLLPGLAAPAADKLTSTFSRLQRQNTVKSATCTSPQSHISTNTTSPPDTKRTNTTIKATSRSNNDLYGEVRTVSTDPNFLEDYFRNSRLSFIGNFKQRTTKAVAGAHHHHIPSPLAEGSSPNKSNQIRSSSPPYKSLRSLIFHIDTDSFFASVVLRRYPQYQRKPVVICHSKNNTSINQSHKLQPKQPSKYSTSECATCNYEARKYGIEKGMFLGEAKKLCPNVIVLPYDFDGYEEVSSKASDIVHSYADRYNGRVEQVSCDEFYAEMMFPESGQTDLTDTAAGNDCYGTFLPPSLSIGEKFPNTYRRSFGYDLAEITAESIRNDIYSETNCTATVGVARNKFLAKVATNKVKPNKCLIVPIDEERKLLKGLGLADLPGIGPKSEKLLYDHDLTSVTDVWELGERHKAEKILTNILGNKNGMKLVEFCHGEDSRKLEPARRKSIGAECNYGVRFDGPYGVDHMIRGLASEVERRMEEAAVKGKHITLKIKKRKEGEGEAFKFLGHGRCHNLSKSCDINGAVAIRDCETIARYGILLWKDLMVDKDDIRGMGIVLTKLIEDNTAACESSVPSVMQAWLHNKPSHEEDSDVVEVASVTDLRGDHQLLLDGEESSISKSSFITNEYASNTNLSNYFFVDDIEIPPISQIDRNEVEAMPQQLREKILKKLYEYEREKAFSSVLLPANSSRHPISSPSSKKEGKKRKTLGSASICSREGKRQLNLKSMLVLASIKSGQEARKIDGERVSLTQLQALPLAVQLEVANQDEMSLESNYSNCMYSPQRIKNRWRTSYTTEKPTKKNTASSGLIDSTYSKKQCNDDELHVSLLSTDSLATIQVVEESRCLIDDVNFLRNWLDAHVPQIADCSIHSPLMMLTEFICLCVDEKRLEHALIFLRMVKYRQDEWRGISYQLLLDNVKKHVKSKHGVNLDEKWHCL